MILAALCTVVVIFLFYNMVFGGNGSTQTKEYTEFLEDLEQDRVEAVELDAENAELTVTLKMDAILQDPETESPGADTSKLERECGYKPSTSLHDGICKFIEWFKSDLNPLKP